MAKTLHRSCDSRLLQSGLGRYLEPQKPLTPSLSQVPVQFGRSGIAVRLALRQNTPSERGVGAFAQAGVHDAPTDNKIRAMTRSRTSASIKPTLYKRYENPALQALLALATYPPNPGSALETYRTLGAAKARLVRTGLQKQLHALGVAVGCGEVERRVASALGEGFEGGGRLGGPPFCRELESGKDPGEDPETAPEEARNCSAVHFLLGFLCLEAACYRRYRYIPTESAPRILHKTKRTGRGSWLR